MVLTPFMIILAPPTSKPR